MKNLFLTCFLLVLVSTLSLTGLAQTDRNGARLDIPQETLKPKIQRIGILLFNNFET